MFKKVSPAWRCDIGVLSEERVVVVNLNEITLYDMSASRDELVPLHTYQARQMYGVTKIAEDEVGVAHSDDRCIKFYSIHNCKIVKSEKEDIRVEGKCYGIEFSDDTLFVVTSEPDMIFQLSINGSILKIYDMDEDLSFGRVSYNSVAKLLYVVSRNSRRITGLTMDGDIALVVEEAPMTECVAVTEKNTVFVVCTDGLYKVNMESGEAIRFGCENRHTASISFIREQKKLYLVDRKQIQVFSVIE